MELNKESIADILSDSRTHVEIVDQPLETVLRNLRARIRIKQRWSFAFIEQQVPGASYPATKKGVLLLRAYHQLNIFEGVYYPRLDCGNDTPAAKATAEILWAINKHIPPEIFTSLWVQHCIKFALWNLYTANEANEIGYKVYEYK